MILCYKLEHPTVCTSASKKDFAFNLSKSRLQFFFFFSPCGREGYLKSKRSGGWLKNKIRNKGTCEHNEKRLRQSTGREEVTNPQRGAEFCRCLLGKSGHRHTSGEILCGGEFFFTGFLKTAAGLFRVDAC